MNELEIMLERFRQHYFGRFKPTPWDLKVRQPEWMLEKLIPAKSLGMVYGPSNSGKTHLICDLIVSMLMGDSHWQGLELKPGPVVLFSESMGHIKARIKAYLSERQGEPAFDLYCVPAMGMDVSEVQFFAMWLDEMPEPPAVVVFDTLATTFALDENDNRQASRLINELETMILPRINETGCCILAHHTSKVSEGRSARGASALIANIDFSINVQWDPKIERTIAQWEKDRWRLVDKAPRWAGDMRRVPVEFENGSTEMAVLRWETYDEEAAELVQTLLEETKIAGMKAELDELIRCAASDPYFHTAKGTREPSGYIKFAVPEHMRPKRPILIEWLQDTKTTEPVFTKSGIECGFIVKK